MALEERRGRLYYYQKRREGNRVVSVYMGAGRFARGLALLDEQTRTQQQDALAQVRAERRQRQELEQHLRDYYDLVRAVVCLALVEAGYHQHRGQWRKTRMPTELTEEAKAARARAFDAWRAALKPTATKHEIQACELAIKEYPFLAAIYGELASVAQRQLLDNCGSPPGVLASIGATLEAMRADMGNATAPALDRLLIEQVCLTWLDYHLVALRYEGATRGSHNMKEAEYWDRRVSTAQRRYLRAVETLVRVRKLGINIQVNIAAAGGQQVNISGGGS